MYYVVTVSRGFFFFSAKVFSNSLESICCYMLVNVCELIYFIGPLAIKRHLDYQCSSTLRCTKERLQ